MVLESILNPFSAEQRPSKLILIGAIYTLVAMILASYIFKETHPSMVFIFLIVMAAIPLMFGIIKREEKKDIKTFSEKSLLKEHSKALSIFMMLFLGIALMVSLWYVVAPLDSSAKIFETQIDTLGGLGHNFDANGKVTELTANAANSSMANFSRIFFNNIKVLIFCIVFSFIYGSGAIFILTWNASVLGVAIGNIIRSGLLDVASKTGFDQIFSYLSVVSVGLFKYSIHGIPEIAAYFVGALAGGIISFSIIRRDFKGKNFERVILDSADLLFIAIGLILVSAVLEVWVTPLIFG